MNNRIEKLAVVPVAHNHTHTLNSSPLPPHDTVPVVTVRRGDGWLPPLDV